MQAAVPNLRGNWEELDSNVPDKLQPERNNAIHKSPMELVSTYSKLECELTPYLKTTRQESLDCLRKFEEFGVNNEDFGEKDSNYEE